MSRVPTPEHFHIAALQRKQQQQATHDPMQPGGGTPWEDRGTHGTAGAFFKTVAASLTSPGKLATSMRRPETTADARGFLIGCGICWGISAVIHGLLWMRGLADDRTIDFDRQNYYINVAIGALAAGFGLWVLFRIYNAIYAKLVAQEKQMGVLSASLLYNTNVYALGPSLLAILPLIGPPLAAVWILVDLVAVGRSRLKLRVAPAVVDAVIPFIVCTVVAVGGFYVGRFVVKQFADATPAVVKPEGGKPGS